MILFLVVVLYSRTAILKYRSELLFRLLRKCRSTYSFCLFLFQKKFTLSSLNLIISCDFELELEFLHEFQ